MTDYDAIHAAAIARDRGVPREVADDAVARLSRQGLARFVALAPKADGMAALIDQLEADEVPA